MNPGEVDSSLSMDMQSTGAWMAGDFLTLLGGYFFFLGFLVAFPYMNPDHLGTQKSVSFFGSTPAQTISWRTEKR